eukprot:gene2362-1489_t
MVKKIVFAGFLAAGLLFCGKDVTPSHGSVRPHELNMLGKCCDFIDSSTDWEVQFSSFKNTATKSTEHVPLEVLQLKDPFVTEDGSRIPCMRIVALFPDVQSKTLFELLTHRELRLRWDFNYQMFENFSDDLTFSPAMPKIGFSSEGFAGSVPHSALIHSGWSTHRVGSSALSRLGVASRQFLYYRWCFEHYFTSNKSSMYSIIYDGSEATCDSAMNINSFKQWVEENKGPTKSIPCLMNYQHISLLPFEDVRHGFQSEALKMISTSGSYQNSTSLLEYLHQLSYLDKKQNKGNSGTVFIITSINDVGIAKGLPQWVQRLIISNVTVKVYDALWKAARRLGSSVRPNPLAIEPLTLPLSQSSPLCLAISPRKFLELQPSVRGQWCSARLFSCGLHEMIDAVRDYPEVTWHCCISPTATRIHGFFFSTCNFHKFLLLTIPF